MMLSSLCCVIICLSPIHVYETQNIYNNRGWRPISNMEALSRFGINDPKSNNVQTSTATWNPTEDINEDNMNILKSSVFRLVEPQHVFGDFKIKRKGYSLAVEERSTKPPNDDQRRDRKCDETNDLNCIEPKIEETKSQHIVDDNSHHNTFDKNIINKPITETSERKAKKIAFDNIKANNINKNSSRTKEDLTDLKQESTNKESIEINNSYEVTENSEAVDIYSADQSQKHPGYFYKPPKLISNITKCNLTDTLTNILSKYNIGSKDELQNYALSRIPSIPNSLKTNLPVVPYQASSFNYLPVNPLLAVLLSNYGYYLPGAYGLRNNYRNLYGYLASNNIHNNKPFGSYKIYSDTDSSNR